MLDYFGSLFAGLAAVLPFSAAGQDPFVFMMIGIAIGFAVGILPGLGGATTLALMLPFIYKMDPVTAFAFLLGSHAVTATTGDITSVLFGVPGEGITAATIVDGHAMAKKGEAGRALGAALMSSLVGAIFGAFALALAIPIVQPLVLSIGAPEFLMLSILGITFLASLSGGNLAKGLTAGGFGLVLAMVGLDKITSVSRYTLEPLLGSQNALFLWDGLSLVAVTVGLFAIPEIIDLGVQRSSIARDAPNRLGGVMEGIRDTFRHWKLVLRCSAIGTYIGLFPVSAAGPPSGSPTPTRCRAGVKRASGRARWRGCSVLVPPTTPRKAARWCPPSPSGYRAASAWRFSWAPSSSRASCPGRTC